MKPAQVMIRSFIAIELSTSLQNQIAQVIADLKSAGRLPVRWLPLENIHLTLKFLGDVEAGQLKLLGEQLSQVTRTLVPFDISIGGIGAFPTAKRPRVVWVGIQAPVELTGLVKLMESLGSKFGIAPEDRPFSPHLTIGRVQQHATVEEIQILTEHLGKMKVGELSRFQVDAVSLFRSDLRPNGAIYTLLSLAKLGE